jgi:hypothetical protein
MMSAVVLMFLLAFASSASGETLNDFFDQNAISHLANDPAGNPLYQKLMTVDIECVKQKVNIAENGNNSADKMTLILAVMPSYAFCSGDALGLAELLVDHLISFMTYSQFIGKGDCFKQALLHIEPDSPMLTGFDSTHMNFTEGVCDRAVDQEGIDKMIARFEDDVSSIDKYTCGVIKKEEIFGFSLKFPIIAYGKLDPKIEKEAKKKLAVDLAGRVEKLVECMVAAISKGDIENEV